MEDLEENLEFKFMNAFSCNYLSVGNGELFDLATPSLATLDTSVTGNGYIHGTTTTSDDSSLNYESNVANPGKAKKESLSRQRELHRLRQQRYRERKHKEKRTATEQLDQILNELKTEEEENTRLKQENRAMTSLVDNASSLLQKMKLSSAASFSRIFEARYRKISQMLEILASFHTFEYGNEEYIESMYTFGARTIIYTATFFLSKSQFRDIMHIPVIRACRLMVEWCDHPERRPALEKTLEVRFHRLVNFFKAIREIRPDMMESVIFLTEDFRRIVKEQYLDHLNHEDLVQATRLTEDQKRKLRLAWREYQRRFCGLNALVTQSIKLLEMDCGGAGGDTSIGDGSLTVTSREMTALPAFPQAFIQSSNEPSLMALGSLHSFQTSEREAYFDMIETTFILAPLQYFRLRLLSLCSSENNLFGMYLAMT